MMSVLNTGIVFRFARRTLRRASLLLLCAALSAAVSVPQAQSAPAKPVIHAGYRTLSSSIPAERLMLHMGVWYPTARKPVRMKVGSWNFRAARGGNILPGPWPVIILSHDVTGSAWSHHDMAASLAARGFIVAAPLHDRDNADDMRMLFTPKQLPLRAMQASAALDAIFAHAQLGPQADWSRVGFVGVGLTAPAGLLLAGGRLSAAGWPEFRAEFGTDQPASAASDSHTDGLGAETSTSLASSAADVRATGRKASPWCAPLLREKMDALALALTQREQDRQTQQAMQDKAELSHASLFSRMKDTVARSHQRQMRMARTEGIPLPPVALPLLPPAPQDKEVADPRFKAAALISPGFSMLFTRDSLGEAKLPMLLVGAGHDPFLLPHEQAERLRALLPNRPKYLSIPEASPAALHAPCPAEHQTAGLDGVCAPVPEELRHRVRTLLLDTLHVFFLRSFGADPVQER